MAQADADLVRLAQPQLGLVTLHQARAAGLSDKMRRQRVKDGRLLPAGTGTWRVAGSPATWEQHLLAAVLAAGRGAVVSHMAAAAWWSFHGVERGAVEVTVARRVRLRQLAGGIVHRPVAPLECSEICTTEHFGVTSPVRTFLDLGSRLSLSQLEDCLDTLSRRGLLSTTSLQQRLEAPEARNRPGCQRLRNVVADGLLSDDGTRPASWLERRTLHIIRAAGLPRPELQVPFDVDGQRYYVDLYYPQAQLIIEAEGHGTHATRRERADDEERRTALLALGYQIVVFTFTQVTRHPDYVATTIRRLLACG